MGALQSFFRAAARWFLPLFLVAILFFFVYQLSVSAHRAEITQRNYRFLSATSSQLATTVTALLVTLPQMCDNREPNAKKECNLPCSTANASALANPSVSFTESLDRLQLTLQIPQKNFYGRSDKEAAEVTCDTDFGLTISSTVTKQSFFDFVMLAARSEKSDKPDSYDILYDISSSGTLNSTGLATLNELLNAELRYQKSGTGWNSLISHSSRGQETSSDAKSGSGVEWLGPGQYEQVRFLANEYILFSVAVRLPSSAREHYVLAGLVQAKRFNAEAEALPPGWQGGALFVISLILLLLFILGVFSKGIRDRLLVVDVLILSFSALIVSMMLTTLLLFIHLDRKTASFFDDLTESFGDEIAKRFKEELLSGAKLLEQVKSASSFRDASIGKIRIDDSGFDREVLFADSQGLVKGIWSAKPADQGKPDLSLQEKDLDTPIPVDDRDYFKRALDNRLWSIRGTSFSVQVVLSKRDRLVNLVLASPTRPEGKAASESSTKVTNGNSSEAVAIVSSKRLPFREPVVPVSFSFAIIDEQGEVQLHSIPGRERTENFFVETSSDRDSPLQAAVSARHKRLLDVNYYGREERIYVRPIPHTSWFVVAIRDTSLIRNAEVQAALACLYLLVLYLFVCASTVAITRIAFGSCGPIMLWPDREQGSRYVTATLLLLLIGVFAFADLWSAGSDEVGTDEKFEVVAGLPVFSLMVIFLVLTGWKNLERSQRAVVVTAGLIGLILWTKGGGVILGCIAGGVILGCVVVSLTLIAFDRWPRAFKQKERGVGSAEAYFRLKYSSMLLALIVVVGLIPSALFFLDSARSELEGVSRLAELRLFSSMNKRTEKVRDDVQGFKISEKNELLTERLKDSRDIYVTEPWLNKPQAPPTAEACEAFGNKKNPTVEGGPSSNLLKAFWENLFLESPFAAELREVMFDASPEKGSSWYWSGHTFAVTDPTLLRQMCVTKYQADFQPPPISNFKRALVLIGLFVCSLFFWSFQKMTTALFLLNADSNPSVPPSTITADYDDYLSNSSIEEKLALRHLAEDGFLPASNTLVVRNLMSRGLIVRNPALSLVNTEFRAHVVNVPKETIRGWETSDEWNVWSDLRVPAQILLVIATLFLFVAQPGLLTSVAAAIGAVTVPFQDLLRVLTGRGSPKNQSS